MVLARYLQAEDLTSSKEVDAASTVVLMDSGLEIEGGGTKVTRDHHQLGLDHLLVVEETDAEAEAEAEAQATDSLSHPCRLQEKTTAPYGSWKSPITADIASKRLGGTAVDSLAPLVWLEYESGRGVLVMKGENTTKRVGSEDFNSRRVECGGGGAFLSFLTACFSQLQRSISHFTTNIFFFFFTKIHLPSQSPLTMVTYESLNNATLLLGKVSFTGSKKMESSFFSRVRLGISDAALWNLTVKAYLDMGFVVYTLGKICARMPRGVEKFIAIAALSTLQIVFVENKKLTATLLEDMDETQLPDIYGGKTQLSISKI
ncbi:unnamed protein product [Eruca vesicaria subsp. sativa]|uniref:Uncharacterized protein n=1 Tax=Eruca vesicaria subsp. sativa TaxID=29727 RepID=A0ABC8J7L5_ERUVS|nr:unnamed protein product [Eruca vesicaria subsp. sativa]